jgi:hypothetical protein
VLQKKNNALPLEGRKRLPQRERDVEDLKSQLAQLKRDLADHRQLNETMLHGEDKVALAIEAELERRIAELEKLIDPPANSD